ncbi:MAG: formyltetrahydrofolate deformylase [Burkholderiales bacterium]|nr:formyltetrahydrofolate deformylase [Burkholderiales bacterium]MDE2396203.1 formyltetrahydrofolate deformylase [Burkholderiales bacterium]MDE2452073.1 formyltetrahydrofolate deformylase [Burkholderiales bacterium]
MNVTQYVLTGRCPDKVGVIAGLTTALARLGAWISESSNHGDAETGLFFVRTVFHIEGTGEQTQARLNEALAPFVEAFAMELDLRPTAQKTKVLLAVSRFGHCLSHLLHKWHSNELPIDVVGVVSNHADLRRAVEWYGLPFHHLPIVDGDKRSQEQAILRLIDDSGAELLVLARYMQVLSDEMCRALQGRCINIHHSFLPSFKGARPYHQAHQRGVKVIGATSHYVTPDLDEGPIIEQDTVRVSHGLEAEDYVRLGKDVENIVLARAVQWHAERRIMLNGQRTVVFPRGY